MIFINTEYITKENAENKAFNLNNYQSYKYNNRQEEPFQQYNFSEYHIYNLPNSNIYNHGYITSGLKFFNGMTAYSVYPDQ